MAWHHERWDVLGRCPPTSASARWEEYSNLKTEVFQLERLQFTVRQVCTTAGRFDALRVSKHFHLYKMEYFWCENLFKLLRHTGMPVPVARDVKIGRWKFRGGCTAQIRKKLLKFHTTGYNEHFSIS